MPPTETTSCASIGVPDSPARKPRLEQFYRGWDERLAAIPFDDLGQAARIDYLLLANHIKREERQLQLDDEAEREIAPLAPFLAAIAELETARRRYEFVEGQAAAEQACGVDRPRRRREVRSRKAAGKGGVERSAEANRWPAGRGRRQRGDANASPLV